MSTGEEMVIALYDYQANDSEELTIRKNEQLTLLDGTGPWYRVRNKTMHVGLVPSNYVKLEKSKGESLVNRIANRFPGTRKGKTSVSGSTLGNPQVPNSHTPGSDGDGGIRKPGGAISDRTMNKTYVAKYVYDPSRADELPLEAGMNIIVISKEDDGWWQGKNADGKVGWFPSNYVEEVSNSGAHQPNNHFSNTVSAPKQALEVVRALYVFNTSNPEELSFEKGDMFDIIGKPEADPEWYEARNAAGQVGLIPRNYIEVVPGAPFVSQPESTNYDDVTSDVNGSSLSGVQTRFDKIPAPGDGPQNMANKPWYFGPLKRMEAENLLYQKARNSEFIVRDSESTVGDLSVSMKAPDKIKHFKVSFRNGKYCIGQRQFDSIETLIDHYRRAPIYTAPDIGKIFLGQPLRR